MNLLRYAAVRAEETGSAHISLGDLAWSYDERLLEHMTPRINPFGRTVGKLFVAPELPPIPDPAGIRRKRRRGNKKEEPSVAETLKA